MVLELVTENLIEVDYYLLEVTLLSHSWTVGRCGMIKHSMASLYLQKSHTLLMSVY